MSEKIDFAGINLFAPLTANQLEELAKITDYVECEEDCKLFSTGEAAGDVFVLLEGKVSIQVQLSSRPEKIDIVVLSQKGQLIGWSGLLGKTHYTASGICQGDTKLLQIDGSAFMKVLESDKEAGFTVLASIMQIVSNRLRNLQGVVLKTM